MGGFHEREVDAVFLDLREPHLFLDNAWACLKGSGFFGALVPTVNQASELIAGLQARPFGDIFVEEVFERPWKPVPGRLRPEDRMIAHSAFLIFARKIEAGDESLKLDARTRSGGRGRGSWRWRSEKAPGASEGLDTRQSGPRRREGYRRRRSTKSANRDGRAHEGSGAREASELHASCIQAWRFVLQPRSRRESRPTCAGALRPNRCPARLLRAVLQYRRIAGCWAARWSRRPLWRRGRQLLLAWRAAWTRGSPTGWRCPRAWASRSPSAWGTVFPSGPGWRWARASRSACWSGSR